MFVFVLIHDCINSYYEWNSFLKKIIFILFFNNKNRSVFSVIKNLFIFIFFYHHNTNLNFYLQKPLFSPHTTKQIWYFDKSKSFFFYQLKYIWLFSKEETSIINKFVWFHFWCHMFNISFMTYMRWYIGHKSLEDKTLFGWNRCLTPSHSVT